MWINPLFADPKYATDQSKSVFQEIKRRLDLQGTEAGGMNGNRITILAAPSAGSGLIKNFSRNIEAHVISPVQQELENVISAADITEINNSSLIIRWTIKVFGGANRILLGGCERRCLGPYLGKL